MAKDEGKGKNTPAAGTAGADEAADQASTIEAAGDTSASTAAPPADVQARTDVPVSLPTEAERPVTETVPSAGGFVSRMPILTPGDTGPVVMELAVLLHQRGYRNDVAEGRAPAILTDALMDRVREFQAAEGHDPRKPEEGGDVSPFRNRAEGVVDARTWAALMGAAPSYDRTLGGGR